MSSQLVFQPAAWERAAREPAERLRKAWEQFPEVKVKKCNWGRHCHANDYWRRREQLRQRSGEAIPNVFQYELLYGL